MALASLLFSLPLHSTVDFLTQIVVSVFMLSGGLVVRVSPVLTVRPVVAREGPSEGKGTETLVSRHWCESWHET